MHNSVLVISDLHIPYHHKDSFKFLKAIKKEFKPDTVINIGDLLDFHAISMHEHPNLKETKTLPIPESLFNLRARAGDFDLRHIAFE